MGVYFYIILNIAMSYCLLHSLYERIYAGKFIIKTKPKKIPVINTMTAVVGGYAAARSFLDYFAGGVGDIYEIFQGVFWMQLCTSQFLGGLSLGIAKGGVYSGDSTVSYFTKWSKVKSYTWISDNVIGFETLTRKGKIFNTELEVDSEQKQEVNRVLKHNLNEIDREVNERGNFKLKVLITLVAVMMIIVNVNLIKISKPYMTRKIKLKEDEAILILKKTWKPLAELNKEKIKSRGEFDKLFQETMTKPMIDELYEILVDGDKSTYGDIKFKEKVRIPTVYDTKMSIEKSYIKAPRYIEGNNQVITEELIIKELLEPYEDGSTSFTRKSTFIKNNNDEWILDSTTGVQSLGSQ
ncbi:DUF5673 domain-containing protein [Clostridium sp. HMP27]|uniref:DUF5673 domain-containing protein n=1 Tax=Clostridium sp. HMP27 TaxID=1487921 RepID=UPI00052BB021|nr:DUF5673 domain-containing protein [Clostridium sp. HMP27]KGK86993.1 hypothetical protein DP68_12375 [Clostridium sp. HMP27]